MAQLSRGSLVSIQQGQNIGPATLHVSQLTIAALGAEGKSRTRCTVTDGQTSCHAILTGNFAQMAANGQVHENDIIVVHDYKNSFVGEKSILLILSAEVKGNAPYEMGQAVGGAPQQQAFVPPQPMAPPQQHFGGWAGAGAAGPVVRAPVNNGGQQVQPIATLNPYNNRWNIKVRVTSKSEVKTWNKPSGAGSMFKVELLDDQGGEIGAAFFKEAVNRFYDAIHVGNVYLMSGGRVKVADKRFSNGREYEINFDEKATVTQTVDDNSVKQVNYMFHKIATMGDLEADRIVDVVGILTSVKEPADIHTKSGKDLVKREIVLADDSGASIECTIWGDKARLPYSEGQILAIKGAKISNWNGKSLGTQNSSTITVDPDLPEAHSMRGWYSSTGGAGITENLSVRGERGGAGGEGGGMASGLTDASLRYTVEGLQQGSLGAGDGTLCHVKATMKYIRNEVDKLAYPACKSLKEGGKPCQKKVTDDGSGNWTCPNCGPVGPPTYRYIMNAAIMDFSGDNYVTLFDDTAQTVLKRSADDMIALGKLANPGEGDGQNPAYDAAFKSAMWEQGLFTIKVKLDTRRDETKIQSTVVKYRPLVGQEVVKENKTLLDNIRKYLQQH